MTSDDIPVTKEYADEQNSPKANGGRARKGRLIAAPPTITKSESSSSTEDVTEWMRSLLSGRPDLVTPNDEAVPMPDAPDSEMAHAAYLDGLRAALAAQVVDTVNGDRQGSYGPPEDSLGVVAELWSVYLQQELLPSDVAALMVLLKVSRAQVNPFHLDSWADVMGYGLIGAGMAAMSSEVPEGDTDE